MADRCAKGLGVRRQVLGDAHAGAADAQALVRQWCADVVFTECALAELAAGNYPAIDWSAIVEPAAQPGDAPAQARDFAARARRA